MDVFDPFLTFYASGKHFHLLCFLKECETKQRPQPQQQQKPSHLAQSTHHPKSQADLVVRSLLTTLLGPWLTNDGRWCGSLLLASAASFRVAYLVYLVGVFLFLSHLKHFHLSRSS